jgi:1-aminocyclopropane-1-carboxylate deaminase/D-cysteine desulfhydrase-like pyridoxal-dependent ACC family enzyme
MLILSGEKPPRSSGNLLLDQLFDAEITWTSHEERDTELKNAFDNAWKAGRRPYLIPYGGSNTTGAASYAYAIQELLEQQCQPDWIVFPSSSGGTQAGMVAGAELFGYPGKVLGISVDESAQDLTERVADLATETSDFMGARHRFLTHEILVDDAYIGEGYAIMGPAEIEAIQLFARTEGLLLDPVYTGKAAAGLIDLTRKSFFKPGETVLFWHTGGTPALFAEKYSKLVSEY